MENGNIKLYICRLSGKDQLFDYWHVYVKPPHKRIRYGFRLKSEQEEITYTEKGFFESVPIRL